MSTPPHPRKFEHTPQEEDNDSGARHSQLPTLTRLHTPPATNIREEMQAMFDELEQRMSQDDAKRRQEDATRFTTLLQLLTIPASQPDAASRGTPSSIQVHTSQNATAQDPDATSRGTPSPTPPPLPEVTPTPSTSTSVPAAQNVPRLCADATFKDFCEWRRRWDDYSVTVDLPLLSRQEQLIHLRMCLPLEIQRVLQRTLDNHPENMIEEALDVLQNYIKTLRRRELLSCRQQEGEAFSDFYMRLKDIEMEIDICPGGSSACKELQLKMIILMGLRDKDLVQKLLSLDTTASLLDVTDTCLTYEATRKATSPIHASSSQPCSSRKQKGQGKAALLKSSLKPCPCCAQKHGSTDKCPAVNSTCYNCGKKGHWSKTQKCPAIAAQCKVCNRMGHYDKCCKQTTNSAMTRQPVQLTQVSDQGDENEGEILCNCRQPAKQLTVTKNSPNKGRQFYRCSKTREEGCDFFQWVDEGRTEMGGWNVKNKGVKRALTQSQQSNKRKCSVCGSHDHNKRRCPHQH